MLGTETEPSTAATAPSGTSLARLLRERALPCGAEPLALLEAAVTEKLSAVRALEQLPEARFRESLERVFGSVVSARAHRERLSRESSTEEIRAIVRDGRKGVLGPGDIPEVANRIAGAPMGVRIDAASELLHGAAPDRVALLARWVWNPTLRCGVLSEFEGAAPESYSGAQLRLGELRYELGTLGFVSPTFAGLDVVLALVYAARVEQAADRGLRSGGLEALLPGAYPLASMILGVRRRLLDADR